MHIVLLILKILGILLLVILGLLLLILCTVLFVPVRYRIQGLWKEEKWIRVQVSWLLSLVSFRGGYDMKKGTDRDGKREEETRTDKRRGENRRSGKR